MKPSIIPLTVLLLLSHLLTAQKGSTFIGIDLGTQVLSARVTNMERIRADISSSTESASSARLRSNSETTFGGVRLERFLFNDKFSFSSGLIYAQTIGEIEKNVGLFNLFTPDFFFYRFREDGVNTEFVSLHRMTQRTDYLTVPLRVRYFPFKVRVFRLFFFAETNIGFQLKSESEVMFNVAAVSHLQDEVVAQFEEPSSVVSEFHLGSGMRLGRPGGVLFGFEVSVPTVSLTQENHGIVEPTAGVNCQLSVSFPLKAKAE